MKLNIESIRTLRGMSPKELAEAAETSTRHLHDLERGRYTPIADMCVRLASALDCSIDALFYGYDGKRFAEESSAYNVADQVKKHRKKKGLLQKELGKHIGTTGAFIRYTESGTTLPKADSLLRLAKAFGVYVGDLFLPVEEEQA